MKLQALIVLVLAAADNWFVGLLVDGADEHVPYFRKLVQQKDPKCSAHKACNRTSGNWYECNTGTLGFALFVVRCRQIVTI
jgi:hypothetical protein